MRTRKTLISVTVLCLLAVLAATSASAAIIVTTAPVVQIAPPSSVQFGALESETEIRAFDESQNVTLTAALDVNISSPGTYSDTSDLTPGTIPAGTVISSHLLHYDSSTGTNRNTARIFGGSIAFDGKIIGVIEQDAELDSSDFLGAAGTAYPTGVLGRGLEHFPPIDSEKDTIVVTCNTLSVDRLANGARIDHIRVLTVDESCASIDIEKSTNGVDADTPTGPIITVGDPVNWEYVVTNDGEVDLTNVTVTDDQGVAVSCPQTTLVVGESMTCTASGTSEAGQYANIGTATGTPPVGLDVSDDDPSHYFGEEPAGGGEGCTPGYWKNHLDQWVTYQPADNYEAVFGVDASFDKDLLGALQQGGGGEKALGRHATAGLLNAANSGVSYFYSDAAVIAIVQDAYATGEFEAAKDLLEAQNGDDTPCPLN